jgi:uncharacterized protein YndB with AHSA1/START domain
MATIETQSPHAQAPVALRLERNYDASPERVFNAWVRPEFVAKWFGPTPDHKAVVTALDPRVGGKYRIELTHVGGNVHVAYGTYREVTPPKKLIMTWAWEGNTALPETLVTVEFAAQGGGTKMVLTHELLPNDEAREAHNKGWIGCLASLETFISAAEK